MANLSYCRWENTANDLTDCVNSLAEVDNLKEWFDNLSDHERRGFENVLAHASMFVNEILPEMESAGITCGGQ
jgi:hypothetical protein